MSLIFNDSIVADRNLLADFVMGRFSQSDLIAVEIGTHRGDFAEQIMQRWTGALLCVDPWVSGYDDDDPASQGDRHADKRTARKTLRKYAPRVNFMETTSLSASNRIADNSLHLVYIDGKHRYVDVLQDLTAWWSKLVEGGILAGHDIVCPGETIPVDGGWGSEVQPAVFEFAAAVKRVIYLVRDPENQPWSYYLIK